MWATIHAAIVEANGHYKAHASIDQPPTDQGNREREDRLKRSYFILDQKQKTLSLTELGTKVLLAELGERCSQLPCVGCCLGPLRHGSRKSQRPTVLAFTAAHVVAEGRGEGMRPRSAAGAHVTQPVWARTPVQAGARATLASARMGPTTCATRRAS